MTPDERYAAVVAEQTALPGVVLGRGLRDDALKAGDKIFAMLVSGRLVVKLPRERVAALVAEGRGERLEAGRRVMKEWVSVDGDADWAALATEARTFVTGG